jgi:hypothetical protein
VQGAAFVVGQIVSFVVRNEVDNRAFGQRGGFVEHEASIFDTSSQRAHAATVRLSDAPDKALHGPGSRSPRGRTPCTYETLVTSSRGSNMPSFNRTFMPMYGRYASRQDLRVPVITKSPVQDAARRRCQCPQAVPNSPGRSEAKRIDAAEHSARLKHVLTGPLVARQTERQNDALIGCRSPS